MVTNIAASSLLPNPIPKHIAFIMDGNGRWAKRQGKDRLFGHLQGVESLKQMIEAGAEIGVQYLTFYAFSTENWQRPDEEVAGLMELLANTIESEADIFHTKNARLLTIGNIGALPRNTQEKVAELIEKTKHNTAINVIIALNYSTKWELLHAINTIIQKEKTFPITAPVLEKYLATHTLPDPELMIRTGGEHRISNFLLYQLAYSELYFTDIFWPDFTKSDFFAAIADYQKRERRFGKISEQVP